MRDLIQFHRKTDKMPVLKGNINDFKFVRLVLARSNDRSIDHYKMLNIDTMNQYFYVREVDNRQMTVFNREIGVSTLERYI